MTTQKSFKRLVRTRMEKTGESYTAARASLLNGNGSGPAAAAPQLTCTDEVIRRRTGHGWEHWFELLDEWGAPERTHPEIARWLVDEQGVAGWDAQSVTVSYERARLGRAVGQRGDTFSATASKTVAVPVDALYDAIVDAAQRARWLPEGDLRERTATRARSARFDWGDGTTRVVFGFEAKTDAKSLVSLEHEKLADAAEAQHMKAFWRERLATLKKVLEA